MLFDGFAIHLSPAPDNVEGHPFHAANNINGIGITVPSFFMFIIG